jgi:hypothetical protein
LNLHDLLRVYFDEERESGRQVDVGSVKEKGRYVLWEQEVGEPLLKLVRRKGM